MNFFQLGEVVSHPLNKDEARRIEANIAKLTG